MKMRYKVIYADTILDLQEKIDLHLEKDSKLQGGIAVALYPPPTWAPSAGWDVVFYQAMLVPIESERHKSLRKEKA